MLLELRIQDFAIIEGITVAFGPGLNIFTGQTGAGKSIIIDAMELILGDRARGDLIRGGMDEAVVEAMFSVDGVEGIGEILAEAGIAHGENLVIKRVVQRAGRNRVYINGSLATLVTLSEVGRHLIDIYGQSEHTSLARPDEHVELLDSFGGFGGLRAEMAEAHRGYVAIKNELEGLRSSAGEAARRKDFLEFQLNELAEAALAPGEEEALKQEVERLRNADLLKEAAAGAESEIYSSEGSMTARLGAFLSALREAASIDPRLSGTVESLESSMYQLEDAAAFLRDYAAAVDSDPAALDAAGARLDLISRLKKKYGGSVEEMLERQSSIAEEMAGIAGSEERIEELDSRLFAAAQKATHVAKRLGSERIRTARELKGDIEKELADLGMSGAIFEVVIEQDVTPEGALRFGEKGADRITFFISP
ncbi:MAG: DNA repair protein RecN, partial [Thermodesulfobacteriota bacterium]